MELELNNTKTLIDNPNLEEHIIKYSSSTFSNKRFSNVEFKGFIMKFEKKTMSFFNIIMFHSFRRRHR